MHDIVAFFILCWQSGTLLRSVCALVVVPLLAWMAIRIITPAIAARNHDPGWQAPLAAAAAAIPGLLLLILATLAVSGGLHAACLENVIGRFLFGAIITVTSVSIVRACVLAGRRSGEATTLIRCSIPATDRLQKIAERCAISARIIADSRSFCALVGIWQPVVIVSEGTLIQLTDEELEAALLHERGHARRGDQIIAIALSFLVDLLPLPAMDLVGIYRHAREVAADHHALARVKPDALAGALLSFVKSNRLTSESAALIGTTGMRERLETLLKATRPRQPSLLGRFALTTALLSVLVAGLAPASAAVFHPVSCAMDTRAMTAH
jgi:Zn-dependent protease with chaperone function